MPKEVNIGTFWIEQTTNLGLNSIVGGRRMVEGINVWRVLIM
jgi:hypothetical protein